MAIVYHLDKRSNITYAYESISYWDKEKKSPRSKRKLIGRLDTETGEIVPTDGRCRKDKKEKALEPKIDYQETCEKLEKKLASQDALIAALQKEITVLKSRR